jgi:exopolysaccharide production protein ExoZ
MMVVYHHARDRVPAFSEALPSPIGQAGVDLFFVISGFIMVVTTWSRPVSPGAFMLRRLIRIAPTYWIYTTLLAFFVVVFPSILKLEVTPAHYLYSLLFIPHESPLDQSVSPLLQPGWTLNYEMFFYCVFAVTLIFSAAYRVVVVTLMLTALIVVGWVFPPSGPVLLTYTSPLVLEFVFGAMIGHVYSMGGLDRLGVAAGWSMMVAGAAMAVIATAFVLPTRPLFDFGDATIRVTTYGLAGALVVTGALAWDTAGRDTTPSLPMRFLGVVGDASYALYLTHLFSIGMLRIIWVKLGMGTEGLPWALAFVAAALVTSIVLALLAYMLLEQPLTTGAQRMLNNRLAIAKA